MIQEEAVEGRRRVTTMTESLAPHFRNDPSIEPPYSSSQISETAFHRETMNIYRLARPETKWIYDMGRDTDRVEEENWIIRWMLWHVFRYRDNRNRNRRATSPGDGKVSGRLDESPEDFKGRIGHATSSKSDDKSMRYFDSPCSYHVQDLQQICAHHRKRNTGILCAIAKPAAIVRVPGSNITTHIRHIVLSTPVHNCSPYNHNRIFLRDGHRATSSGQYLRHDSSIALVVECMGTSFDIVGRPTSHGRGRNGSISALLLRNIIPGCHHKAVERAGPRIHRRMLSPTPRWICGVRPGWIDDCTTGGLRPGGKQMVRRR